MFRKTNAAVAATVSLFALLIAGSVLSQSQGAEGQYRDLLIQALTAVADGDCPDSLMSPMTADACEQQVDAMRSRLKSLGSIRNVKFRGMQSLPGGQAEAYRVSFENGSMSWFINAGPDGKILVFWTSG